jgi:hypothetical protein
MAQAPLAYNVPIVNEDGTPSAEFLRKWQEQINVNATIPALSTSTAVSAVLDLVTSTPGSLLLRTSVAWGGLASPSDATRFLNGAASPSFAQVKDTDLFFADNTTNNVSAAKHGFVPKAPAVATQYLDGTGAWSTPAGGGSGTLFGQPQTGTMQTLAGSFCGIGNAFYTPNSFKLYGIFATARISGGAHTFRAYLVTGSGFGATTITASSVTQVGPDFVTPSLINSTWYGLNFIPASAVSLSAGSYMLLVVDVSLASGTTSCGILNNGVLTCALNGGYWYGSYSCTTLTPTIGTTFSSNTSNHNIWLLGSI